MFTRKLLVLWASALLLAPLSVLAENSTKVPGYTIHHNVLTTDVLTPTVARTYQIRRSKNRAMLNVSVVRDVPGTTGQSVSADVQAVAINLMGQRQQLPMREIREGDAVYYISDFLVANRERLNFDLAVKPEGSNEVFAAKLSEEFFTY